MGALRGMGCLAMSCRLLSVLLIVVFFGLGERTGEAANPGPVFAGFDDSEASLKSDDDVSFACGLVDPEHGGA